MRCGGWGAGHGPQETRETHCGCWASSPPSTSRPRASSHQSLLSGWRERFRDDPTQEGMTGRGRGDVLMWNFRHHRPAGGEGVP